MTRAVVIAVLCLAAATAASAQDTKAQASTPVSAERISEGLKRPELDIPTVTLPETPVFRTNVRGDWPIETNLEWVRRQLAEDNGYHRSSVPGVGTTPPLVAVDVLPAIMSGIKHIRDIRYAHAVEDARERVAADLAAFCAERDCDATPASEGVVTR